MTDDDSEVIRSERGVLLLLLLRVECKWFSVRDDDCC